MLVQTIQSNFDEGTEDIIKTIKKLLDYPIQPCKRSYIQEIFGPVKVDVTPVLRPIKKKGFLNGSTLPSRKFAKTDKKNKSISKKQLFKDKRTDKEKEQDRKMKMYQDHIIMNQKLNGLDVNPYGNTRFLKFVIGKGNNSILARVALKTRWWWSEIQKGQENSSNYKSGKNIRNKANFNFIWTQWKSNKVVNQLPKHTEEKESKINDLKDDTTKNSDTDDMVSTTQSFSETMVTPKSNRLKRLNSDSATRKMNTPDSVTRSDSKIKKEINEDKEPLDTEGTII